MKTYDVVIVGAGISGLSLAHSAARAGLETLVIEKADRAGGCFHSHEFDGDAVGFWLELGAHTCYSSYGELVNVIEEAGILDKLVPRERHSFRLFVDGELKSIPSRLDYAELLLSVPRMFSAKKDGESMQSYYSRILGRRNYERVFGPVFDAIISQSARDFPADVLFKKRTRRKDVPKDFTFAYGLQTITDKLAAEPEITLVTGEEAQSVLFKGDCFITATDWDSYESRFLAVATPPPAASMLLRAAFPGLSGHLSRIKVGTVETVGVALPKDEMKVPLLAGIIAVDEKFFSAVARDVLKHETHRGFAFHFKPGLLDLHAKIKLIGDVLKVSPRMIDHVALKNDNFIPSLTLGHDAWVKEADRLLDGTPLMLTGNYFSGVAIEDCVLRSKYEFSRIRAMLEGRSALQAA